MSQYKASLILISSLVALLSIFIQGCDRAQSQPIIDHITPVKVITVPDSEHQTGLSFVAQAAAGEQAQLAFQVPGEVAFLKVKMGQSVSKGDLLASLDPYDYQLNVAARQAEFELQQARLKRAKHLFSKQLVSADSFDQTKTAYTAAQLKLEQARVDLSYTELRAPFSGQISLSQVKPYQVVGAKQTVLTLFNNQYFDLDFNLPVHLTKEVNLNELKQAQLHVRLKRFDDLVLPAQFKEMSAQPDPETNSYKVTLRVKRPEQINILPGMSGTVLLQQANAIANLTLPEGSLFSQQGLTAQVWRLSPDSGQLELIAVILNEKGQVIEGLNAGDMIVSAGAKQLTSGQSVRPWVKEGGI